MKEVVDSIEDLFDACDMWDCELVFNSYLGKVTLHHKEEFALIESVITLESRGFIPGTKPKYDKLNGVYTTTMYYTK